MARIRSIHPGLWTDESFVTLSPVARLLFIGLWNESDDQGLFKWKPVTLKMRILPADSCDVVQLLAELVQAGMVRRYDVEGEGFGAVRNFRKFQRPEKPNAVHPLTDEIRDYVALMCAAHTASTKKAPSFGSLTPGVVGDHSPTYSRSHSNPSPADSRSLAGESVSDGGALANGPRLLDDHSLTPPRFSGQMEEGGGKRERILFSASSDAEKQSKPAKPRLQADWRADEDFTAFYSRYPRKIEPADAYKAWQKAIRFAAPEQIIAGLTTYPFQPDLNHVPYPAVWLNRRAWETEPQNTTSSKPPPLPVSTASGRALSDAELFTVST